LAKFVKIDASFLKEIELIILTKRRSKMRETEKTIEQIEKIAQFFGMTVKVTPKKGGMCEPIGKDVAADGSQTRLDSPFGNDPAVQEYGEYNPDAQRSTQSSVKSK